MADSDHIRAPPQQADRQQQRLRAKREGGYWDRDGRRRASRPVHVLVDPAAWERAKATVLTKRSSVGTLVGELVTHEVRRPRRRQDVSAPGPTDVRLFARIALEPETWVVARTLAPLAGVTVERFVGVIVAERFA